MTVEQMAAVIQVFQIKHALCTSPAPKWADVEKTLPKGK
jgi:hypothetical protein